MGDKATVKRRRKCAVVCGSRNGEKFNEDLAATLVRIQVEFGGQVDHITPQTHFHDGAAYFSAFLEFTIYDEVPEESTDETDSPPRKFGQS